MKKLIIAVDFDGTLCDHTYPDPPIGPPNRTLIEILISIRSQGHRLILWTCRGIDPNGKDILTPAIEWCKGHGLEFDAINEDVPEVKNSEFGKHKSPKVYADIYIDDKNVSIVDVLEIFIKQSEI